MAGPVAQHPSQAEGTHLVLYDGVCGLCTWIVQFLLRHDHRRLFNFASLQSATGTALVERFGRNPLELTTFYLVADYRTSRARILARSDAALFVIRHLGWPWKAASWMRLVPRALRDSAYDFIARHRHQMFGPHEQCSLPDPRFRDRFLD